MKKALISVIFFSVIATGFSKNAESTILPLVQLKKTVQVNFKNYTLYQYQLGQLKSQHDWHIIHRQNRERNEISHVLVSKSPVAGQMEEPYAICQLEMTVAGTVIHTDWIQWSSNCSDIPQAAASFRVPLQATLKAIFYARHSLGVPEGYKIIYNRLCFKTGQVVIQHMEDIKSDHCPVSYTSSNSRSFAALPPSEEACPPLGDDLAVSQLIDRVFPKTVQCAFGPNTTSTCENGTWTEEVACYNCQSDPCQHGGTCMTSYNNVHRCMCPTGFTGQYCQLETDECKSEPCLNQGQCIDQHNQYECRCSMGFSGTVCEEDIDECSSSPCLNGGICKDAANSYSCICPAGHTGQSCEYETDECSSDPCFNGGLCIDVPNGFECTCSSGYHGIYCEKFNSSSIVGGTVGVLASILLLAVLVFVVYKIRKQQNHEPDTDRHIYVCADHYADIDVNDMKARHSAVFAPPTPARSPKGKNVADLDGDYLEPVKLSNDFTYLELSKKASNIYEDFANYYHM